MKKSVANDAMKKGFILGILFSINFMIGTTTFSFLQFGVLFIILGLTFYYTKKCRDVVMEGSISFGKAWRYIFKLFLFASLISAFVKYIYFKYINVGYADELKNKVLLQYEKMQLPDDMMVKMQEVSDTVFTPISISVNGIWVNLFYAVFIVLIFALIIKKEKSLFD